MMIRRLEYQVSIVSLTLDKNVSLTKLLTPEKVRDCQFKESLS